MANEKEVKGSNATPLVIIAGIALVTVVAIYWVAQSGATQPAANTTTTANGETQADRQAQSYANAPKGAQPERFKGAANANVVLEEFADFECGACAAKHSVFNEIISTYGSKIKFVFRHYPLVRMHPKSYDAAVATEAAGFQNKFWEVQNLIFMNQMKWMNDPNHRKMFEEYAKTVGVDVDRFSTDALGLNAKNRVDADMQRGNALGVQSTPSLFVNGKPVAFEQMTVDGLKAIIDKELEVFEPKKDDEPADGDDAEKKDGEDDKKEDEKSE